VVKTCEITAEPTCMDESLVICCTRGASRTGAGKKPPGEGRGPKNDSENRLGYEGIRSQDNGRKKRTVLHDESISRGHALIDKVILVRTNQRRFQPAWLPSRSKFIDDSDPIPSVEIEFMCRRPGASSYGSKWGERACDGPDKAIDEREAVRASSIMYVRCCCRVC